MKGDAVFGAVNSATLAFKSAFPEAENCDPVTSATPQMLCLSTIVYNVAGSSNSPLICLDLKVSVS